MSGRFESPWSRWSRDVRELLHLSEAQLLDAFLVYFTRTVTNDRLVSIDAVDYELPQALGPAGRRRCKVQIVHRLLDDTYHVVCAERLVRIHPVDLAGNARAPRLRRKVEERPSAPPPHTAADMAFERDLGPVVDEHGGLDERAVTPEHEDPS